MKVEEPPPIQASRQVGTEQSVPPADAAGGSRDERRSGSDEREAHQELQDVAAVHGVEEDDLTPNVRGAMVGLIAEVASLREELEQNRNRLEYLTALSDQDSVSLTLNRRAFVRELTRALTIARQRNTHSSLIFAEIGNLKSVNTRLGLAAGDAAIEHVAGIIQNNIPEGNVIGRIGGAELGIILIGEPETLARERAQVLADSVSARPLIWESSQVTLTLIWGTHFLQDGEDAGAAMNVADRSMRISTMEARHK